MYLGAKHMFTGYDHILFLLGVIFFLYKLKEIGLYVSLFALGHSTTMLLGVYSGANISGYLIDAIIGLSVAYKALDNLATFNAGLVCSRIPKSRRSYSAFPWLWPGYKNSGVRSFSERYLLANLVAFNVGVEIGQLLASAAHSDCDGLLARTGSFLRQCLHYQCRHTDRRFRAHWLSTHRLFRQITFEE